MRLEVPVLNSWIVEWTCRNWMDWSKTHDCCLRNTEVRAHPARTRQEKKIRRLTNGITGTARNKQNQDNPLRMKICLAFLNLELLQDGSKTHKCFLRNTTEHTKPDGFILESRKNPNGLMENPKPHKNHSEKEIASLFRSVRREVYWSCLLDS